MSEARSGIPALHCPQCGAVFLAITRHSCMARPLAPITATGGTVRITITGSPFATVDDANGISHVLSPGKCPCGKVHYGTLDSDHLGDSPPMRSRPLDKPRSRLRRWLGLSTVNVGGISPADESSDSRDSNSDTASAGGRADHNESNAGHASERMPGMVTP